MRRYGLGMLSVLCRN